ncbi:carboxypeptidase-like regulatory domain-containing protein [Mangrovimonas sp. AS39]|uniref:carboxypeptidase-like regulatory domain-containing protein n=1 Tax=Mangrovimonas futianensis TaxID=2895523 RepID=UPI001E370640|nr:carboxypeptidase-like regulatory domain-containing protein [Mangrovimonas futianensis]MCF1191991.1 carboxypeptidase-like regulatory domain-containing protein [Mangrovimonas futianensis]MCF1195685.1 carboxypeptidase-like regulatory domain-containing protein [Mangrovimonas futianensis]
MKIKTIYFLMIIICLISCDCHQVVEGIVLDINSKKPIENVLVFNKNKEWSKTKTDSLGKFRLSNVSGGFRCPPMSIVIEHKDYQLEETKIDAGGYSKIELTKKSNIPQGTFIYELYFAEFGGRMPNVECKVRLKGNEITVEQTEGTNLTGGKEIFRGLILKHKSGKWILTNDENDVNVDEIGGCTEIPIIEFDKKLIEWC